MRHRTTAAAVLLAALAALTACGPEDNSTDAAPKATKPAAPAYEITHQDTEGNQRTVSVEVKTADNLRAVFDDVAGTLKDEAGWFVEINCATGGTGSSDNRLANGRKAVGTMGAASTGLDDGQTEYEPVKGSACPA